MGSYANPGAPAGTVTSTPCSQSSDKVKLSLTATPQAQSPGTQGLCSTLTLARSPLHNGCAFFMQAHLVTGKGARPSRSVQRLQPLQPRISGATAAALAYSHSHREIQHPTAMPQVWARSARCDMSCTLWSATLNNSSADEYVRLTRVAIPAGAAEAAIAVGAARVCSASGRAAHALVDIDVAGEALIPASPCNIVCCLPATAVADCHTYSNVRLPRG